MRDYVLNRAMSLEEVGGGAWLRRLWRNFTARRAVSRLETYDDNLLKDIGVTRDEVTWAAHLPLSVNAALALEERSHSRLHFNGRRLR
jgi:uncharacterized protein YjiS (DUF1127 family)